LVCRRWEEFGLKQVLLDLNSKRRKKLQMTANGVILGVQGNNVGEEGRHETRFTP
jgi:hypothetical protein